MVIIKDSECTRKSPITNGHSETFIYGSGRVIKPQCPGKQESEYDKKIFLSELLPLEDYDLIIVLFSGGKDSIAAYYKLLELGVPKDKIELWHHNVDGGHPTRRMDWPVTQAYICAFADAEGVKLKTSWRENGFFGELYRVGHSNPVRFDDECEIKSGPMTQPCFDSVQVQALLPKEKEALNAFNTRLKFPAKCGDLNRRWCSAYLKISVADTVIRNMESVRFNKKLLLVSGERRGESAGRAKYNEMEVHRVNATAKAHRLVHQWRAVIDYSLRDVWNVLKRHKVTPHPCYSCGWGRCSCMCCIFSLPCHWAGIKELFPDVYEAFCQDEIRLGFTLDSKKTLDEYVGDTKSCVNRNNKQAINQLITGQFSQTDIFQDGDWDFPAGAFKGTTGGPC